jgi:hypothetical protein
VELLHGVTFAINSSAVTAHCARVAPPGMASTTQQLVCRGPLPSLLTKNTSNLEIYAEFTAAYYKFTSNTLDFSPQVNTLNWGIARGVGAAAGGKVCRGAWACVTVDRFRPLALQTF